MNNDQTQEVWQVEANGKIFETNFVEMTAWIDEGALLRQDKVRKGNLRWIEAGKVPSLMAVFNAKDNGIAPTPVITTTKLSPTSLPGSQAANPDNYPPATAEFTSEPMCSMHADVPSAFVCETCANQFCKACPNSYGGTVKICPFCGAMCRALALFEQARSESETYQSALSEGFGFSDFAAAVAYPFKFKASLVLGALMFMFFSIGQSAVGFGGFIMVGASIFSFMLANTLTFGVLANTVENFSQGKVGLNFMPSFDDFSLWDDVVHPFFLSIGVYISSFGPLIAVALVALFLVMGTVTNDLNGIQSDAVRSVNPQLPYAANAAKQSEKVREILNQNLEGQKQRKADFEAQQNRVMTAVESGEELKEPAVKSPSQIDEAEIAEVQKMIENSRKAQLESVVGRTPETVAKDQQALYSKIQGYGLVFILLGGVCLLWGLFYFPAACAVAGYTRSFAATLNPSVGFDTIRRLGSFYIKILLMGLAILFISSLVGGFLSIVFAPFNMPGVGNIPAKAIGSVFTFYFSVVFSCVIGFAMYKASDRLNLFR